MFIYLLIYYIEFTRENKQNIKIPEELNTQGNRPRSLSQKKMDKKQKKTNSIKTKS